MKKILLAGFILTLFIICYQSFITDQRSVPPRSWELQTVISTETQETMSLGGKGIALMVSLLVIMIAMLTMRRTELDSVDWDVR